MFVYKDLYILLCEFNVHYRRICKILRLASNRDLKIMRSSCRFLFTITLDLSFFFHTATHSSLTHSLTYNDSSDNKSVLSINFMFIFFLLISSAWCGKIFTHATSPALSKGEAVTVTVSGDTVPRSSVALVLPPLPYAYDALKPYLGEETLRIHHDKHHAKVQYICLCHSIYVRVEYSTVQYCLTHYFSRLRNTI
jgi:hypothetical protein